MPGGSLVIIGGHEDRERQRRILVEVAARAAHGPLLICTAATEDTAVVTDNGRRFDVVGSGAVYVVDGRAASRTSAARALSLIGVTVHLLGEGDGFDLAHEQVIPLAGRRRPQQRTA